jgi:hypothetical protein
LVILLTNEEEQRQTVSNFWVNDLLEEEDDEGGRKIWRKGLKEQEKGAKAMLERGDEVGDVGVPVEIRVECETKVFVGRFEGEGGFLKGEFRIDGEELAFVGEEEYC